MPAVAYRGEGQCPRLPYFIPSARPRRCRNISPIFTSRFEERPAPEFEHEIRYDSDKAARARPGRGPMTWRIAARVCIQP